MYSTVGGMTLKCQNFVCRRDEGDMSERPRLNLKPRDENAAHALDAARAAKSANNPFGEAGALNEQMGWFLGDSKLKRCV